MDKNSGKVCPGHRMGVYCEISVLKSVTRIILWMVHSTIIGIKRDKHHFSEGEYQLHFINLDSSLSLDLRFCMTDSYFTALKYFSHSIFLFCMYTYS